MDNEKLTIEKGNRVYLHLSPSKEYKPKREIGRLYGRTFRTYRNPENMYYRRSKSLAMNYRWLYDGGSYFDRIEIEYGFGNILVTSREFFLRFGEFGHYKKNNLDKQLFLRLDLFGEEKLREFEELKKYEREQAEKNKPIKKAFKKVRAVQELLFSN